MTQLPAGWFNAALSDVADVVMGQSPPGSSYNKDGEGLPFFQGKADFTRDIAKVRTYTTAGTKFASAGDVLMSVRAPVGPTNVCPSTAVIGRGLAGIRAKEGVDQKYLHWALRASVRQLEVLGAGTTFPAITGRQLRAHPISVAPPAEQWRIVAILEDHLSRLDAADNSLSVVQKRAETLRRSIDERVFWSGRDDVRMLRVGDLLAEPMRNGHSSRAVTGNGAGLRTLTLTAVTRHEFSERFTKMTVADPRRVTDLWLKPGDILVQRSNTPQLVGTAALYTGLPEWSIFPDLVIRLRADEATVTSQYLAAVLQTERAHELFRKKARGLAGSMPKIDQAGVASTVLPIPPLPRQQSIVDQLAETNKLVAQLRTSTEATRERKERLSRELLSAAFSGRLVGRSSNADNAEEPADRSPNVSRDPFCPPVG